MEVIAGPVVVNGELAVVDALPQARLANEPFGQLAKLDVAGSNPVGRCNSCPRLEARTATTGTWRNLQEPGCNSCGTIGEPAQCWRDRRRTNEVG